MTFMDLQSRLDRSMGPALDVTGKTVLYPVIGHPVAQVRAPAVFNALFARAGVDALVVALDLPPHSVVEASRALLDSRSVGGLLVTVPYKKTLFELLGRAGMEAQLVGATNAIRKAEDGTLVGELFDGLGFVRGLQAAGHALAGKKVLLLGAGGAGSAIAAALAARAVGALRIFDPHGAHGVDLADLLRRHYPDCEFTPVDRPLADDCEIVVNATPLGMKESDPLPMDPMTLDARTLVADVIMQPAHTRLLQRAQQRGCLTHPGQPMLDHQVPAYLNFFGLDAAAEIASSWLQDRGGRMPIQQRDGSGHPNREQT